MCTTGRIAIVQAQAPKLKLEYTILCTIPQWSINIGTGFVG